MKTITKDKKELGTHELLILKRRSKDAQAKVNSLSQALFKTKMFNLFYSYPQVSNTAEIVTRAAVSPTMLKPLLGCRDASTVNVVHLGMALKLKQRFSDATTVAKNSMQPHEKRSTRTRF